MITILSLFSNTAQDKRKNKNTVDPIPFKNTLMVEEDLGWLNVPCVITAACRQTIPKPNSKANFFPRKVTMFQMKRRKLRLWGAAAFHTARWKKVFVNTTQGHSGKANFILVRWGGHLCQWHLNDTWLQQGLPLICSLLGARWQKESGAITPFGKG